MRARPDLAEGVRLAILDLLTKRCAVLLFATTGIYPGTSALAESQRRLAHRLLPDAIDRTQLKDVVGRLFRRGDARWLEAIEASDWAALIAVLELDAAALAGLRRDLIEALRVVAHRVAAAGLEAEMLRLDPELEAHASPFLAQCQEALAFAERIEAGNRAAPDPGGEAGLPAPVEVRHYLVLLDQCREAIERVRRRAQQRGASFHLTFRLRRLRQHLDRARQLAELAAALALGESRRALPLAAELWRVLALAECRRNDLYRFWGENLELVALRVTENAGRAGEHYITERRADYFRMLRSAAIGGFIIAFMAANKLYLGSLGLPPLIEVLAFCLNYGLGFVFIHMLHGSVATKQPAMTANAIAASIGEAGERGRERDLAPLVELVARTLRSQLAAILGNVGLAVPMAILFASLYLALSGTPFVDADQARYLLAELDPVGSGALIYAGIAGVCLFLAGLIAGYYDNLCAYNRIPERLRQLAWPARMFGRARWQRFTTYIENNLGALAGNFFFGFLLGGVAGLGMLSGLPLDIRHIAFSSAYWGHALVGLEFAAPAGTLVLAALGVLGIGLVNLAVSFYLALWVGLKARGVTFGARVKLLRALLLRLRQEPRAFFLPPRD